MATPEAGGIAEFAADTGTIAVDSFGPAFSAALAAAPRKTALALRPSLLPAGYRRDRIIARYAELLAEVGTLTAALDV